MTDIFAREIKQAFSHARDAADFRIDTTKHIAPSAIETFGNAIREFAQILGKRNFFTFGEILDVEKSIDRFVGRHSPNNTGFGVDAALDYPLFSKLANCSLPCALTVRAPAAN